MVAFAHESDDSHSHDEDGGRPFEQDRRRATGPNLYSRRTGEPGTFWSFRRMNHFMKAIGYSTPGSVDVLMDIDLPTLFSFGHSMSHLIYRASDPLRILTEDNIGWIRLVSFICEPASMI